MNNYSDNLLANVFSGVQNSENAQAVNEMLDKFGLNWTVSKQPLSLSDGTKTPFFGIVRDDNKETFSTCRDSYQPFQNTELSEMLIRLSEKTGYAIHKGGCFNGGAKVYLQLESPNKIKGIGQNNDTVNGFLTGINSHDGTTSLKWGETNITISCFNTFMAALRQIKGSIRHTRSITDRVEQAILEVTGIVKVEKTLFDTFIQLSSIPVKKDGIVRIVKDITEVDTTISREQLEKEYSTYSINRANELLASIAKEMKQKGETMWGLFSGVTQYTSHKMPVPNRDNARLESLYTGTGYKLNNSAFDLVQELAGI